VVGQVYAKCVARESAASCGTRGGSYTCTESGASHKLVAERAKSSFKGRIGGEAQAHAACHKLCS